MESFSFANAVSSSLRRTRGPKATVAVILAMVPLAMVSLPVAAAGDTTACCLPGGECADLSPEVCTREGGQPLGPGSECQLPQPCCLVGIATVFCVDTDPRCCEMIGGSVQPDAGGCQSRQACCLDHGICQDLNPPCCEDFGGRPQGEDVFCDNIILCAADDCQPTADGQRCRQANCSTATQECVPESLICDINGNCRIESCNCRNPELCHIELDPTSSPGGTTCVGLCPVGTRCVQEIEELSAEGVFRRRCVCDPPVEACCLEADGCFELPPVLCSIEGGEPLGPGSECHPPKPCCFVGDVTGFCSEMDPRCCERRGGIVQPNIDACGEPQACCLGTEFCVDVSPTCCDELGGRLPGAGMKCADVSCAPEGCEPAVNGFYCVPFHCPATQEVCATQVVACGPNGQCRVESCECGDPNRCHIEFDRSNPADPPCVGSCPPGTECVRRIGELSPDGIIRYWCDCEPVLEACCLGEDGCKELPPQLCLIEGGEPLGPGSECLNTNPCCFVGDVTARCTDMDPRCCHRIGGIIQQNFAACSEPRACCLGTEFCVDVDPSCCDELGGQRQGPGVKCDDDPCAPDECEPAANGLHCEPFDCPATQEVCATQVVACGPNGECRVESCECGDPNRCHIEFDRSNPADSPCVGFCPPGSECVRRSGELSPDGLIRHWCVCEPAVEACCLGLDGCLELPPELCSIEGGEPLGPGSECHPPKPCCFVGDITAFCSDMDPRCCERLGGIVQPNIDACGEPQACCLGTEFCVEVSPACCDELGGRLHGAGMQCEDVSCAPEGCEPAEGGTHCRPTECPEDNQRCVPIRIRCLPGLPCHVVECECRDAEKCHVELTDPAGPVCVGACPEGQICELVRLDLPDGFELTCRCVTPECEPAPSGDHCVPSPCPEASQVCVAVKVMCGPGPDSCRVVECDCRNPERCHVELDPPATPFCVGFCPPGTECVEKVELLPTDQTVHVCICEPDLQGCCLDSGRCEDLPPHLCRELGGEPLGADSECGPPSPCCLFDGTSMECLETDRRCCHLIGGIPQAVGDVCTSREACCLPLGGCVDSDPICCDDIGGFAQGAGTSCHRNDCPRPPVIVHADGQIGQTRPCSGYVDPRSESNDGVHVNLGLTHVTLVFNEPVFSIGGGPVTSASFFVTETGPGPAPTVVGIDATRNPLIQLRLSRIITVQEWTTIRAFVRNAAGVLIPNLGNRGELNEPDRLDVGYMPCDVNQDKKCNPLDLSLFRFMLISGAHPACGLREDYLDTNRNGSINPLDLTRFRQLVFGTSPPATQPWALMTMNHRRP